MNRYETTLLLDRLLAVKAKYGSSVYNRTLQALQDEYGVDVFPSWLGLLRPPYTSINLSGYQPDLTLPLHVLTDMCCHPWQSIDHYPFDDTIMSYLYVLSNAFEYTAEDQEPIIDEN